MKSFTLAIFMCIALSGCATAIAVVDVTASTVIYTGKTIVGFIVP